MGEHRVGAVGVVAPRLCGEHGHQLHQAGAVLGAWAEPGRRPLTAPAQGRPPLWERARALVLLAFHPVPV